MVISHTDLLMPTDMVLAAHPRPMASIGNLGVALEHTMHATSESIYGIGISSTIYKPDSNW